MSNPSSGEQGGLPFQGLHSFEEGVDPASPVSGFCVSNPEGDQADPAFSRAEHEVKVLASEYVDADGITSVRVRSKPAGLGGVGAEDVLERTAPSSLKEFSVSEYLGMIELCERVGASDLHLCSGEVPMLRHQLDLKYFASEHYHCPCSMASLDAFFQHLVSVSAAGGGYAQFERVGWLDFSFAHRGISVRGNGYRRHGGVGIALRFLYKKYASLEHLDLVKVLTPFLRRPSGLIMVTGPTGSAKTTSAVGMLEWLNTNYAYHIATIEDPVEYVVTERRSRITARSVPNDVESFESALKSVLRQDPDVIFLGEMRDLPVMRKVLHAAETGHLVITTMHADSVIHCFQRILLSFPVEEQPFVRETLASLPMAVVNQRLLPGTKGLVLGYEFFHHVHATRGSLRNSDFTSWDHAISSTPTMKKWDVRLRELFSANRITRQTLDEYARDGSISI